MLPCSLRPLPRVLASVAALVLALANFSRLGAVVITDAGPSEKGKLKPETRIAEPEVEAASEEGQLALSRMKLPAGIKATLWAAEPMLANPVAFNLDEQGRVFVAETYRYRTSVLDIRDYMWTLEDDLANRTQDDFVASIRKNFGEKGLKELSVESERIKLIEDTNGDGVADKASVYADNFREPIDGIASGVLAHRGTVWFTNIPSLWNFTGKDKAETRTEMFRGFGLRFNYTGHDFHGLVLGPDGRIYMSIGDRAAHVPTKEGTIVDTPDTGSVFRVWPDGSGFELFATGLRNPQSLLFNEYGDLFTGDNDSDQGDEERLVHVLEAGDSGWRIGYQHAPRGQAGPWNAEKLWHPRFASQPAYLIPPICNIEDGPSGVAYHPGTGLLPGYEHTIFITHFKGSITSSGIFAYKVKPAGATYAIDTASQFLGGALPTDVRFGPDGKMYYSDWAEGWPKSKRGRIYTIFNEAKAGDPAAKAVQALIGSDFTKKTDAELAALLAHADWRVRLEAQYALAERGAATIPLFNAAAAGDNELARRHAVWGLSQVARKDAAGTAALRPLLTHADAEVRAQAANALGDLRDTASAAALTSALTDPAARVKYFAALALGKIRAADATPALLAAARANADTDVALRHAIVMGLVGCATSDQLVATAKDESRAVRIAGLLALRRHADAGVTAFLTDAGVTAFLTDADRYVVREATEAINDAPITAAYPALAAFVTRPVDDEPIMLRALNAAFRLGGDAQAAAIAAFAASDASPTLRQEALSLLGLWPTPPARDRIVGIYRPLADKTRPTEAVAAALVPHLDRILGANTPDAVQLGAIEAVVGLKIAGALPALHAVVAAAGKSDQVRAAAQKALDSLSDPADAPKDSVTVLTKVLERGTPKEQQAAFHALGAAKDPAADDVLLAYLGKLAAGQVAAAAQLDLLDAAALRSDPRVKQALADRDAALAKDPDPLAPFRVCLEGGTGFNAIKLFTSNPVIQCSRCHRVDDGPGGEAGPNLAGIGQRGTREYILESIIKPSAKLAPGYEIVTVTKKDGTAIVGTLVERSAAGVKVKTSDATLTFAAADLKSVESAPSAMPEVAALVLTKAEIRDLVEGLSSLKTEAAHGPKVIRALRHFNDN